MNVYAIWPTFVLAFSCTLWITGRGELANKSNNTKSQLKSSSHTTTTMDSSLSCVHCASPRSVLKSDKMLEAMDQLLEIRGTSYPYDAVDPNCGRKYNFSTAIPREKCKLPYCFTITFDDREGMPLVIRGCAESYLASKRLQNNQKPSYCRRVHPELDIKECVCRNRDVCSSRGSLIARPLLPIFSSLLLSIAFSLFFIVNCFS